MKLLKQTIWTYCLIQLLCPNKAHGPNKAHPLLDLKIWVKYENCHQAKKPLDKTLECIRLPSLTYKHSFVKYNQIKYKAIAMMRRKSPRSENIYLIENHCQANISK